MPAFGVQRYNIPDAARLAQAEQEKYDLRGLGQLAGGAMGKRDRDIAYNRANGKTDTRTTLGEGVGKAWDWAKDKGQDVLDLVAPVATEFKESGARLMQPLVDWAEPKLDTFNSELEYQIDPFHKLDSEKAEYEDAQGKAKWEDKGLPAPEGMATDTAPAPEEVGAELPMPPELASENVIQGAPAEDAGAPGLPAPKGVSQLAAAKAEPMPAPLTEETPKVPDNVIAPGGKDWGRLFQIDPERAKFEWQQEYQQGVLAQKAGQASSLEELQQLWKDNNRALTSAQERQDAPAIKMYQENLDRLKPLLQEKAPSLWGKAPTPVSDTPAPAEAAADGKDKGLTPKQQAHTDAYAQVDLLADEDKNGTLDNLLAVDRAIKSIRDKYGVSDADMRDVYAQVELAKSKAKEEKDATDRDRQTALDNKLKNEAAGRSGGAVDERAALLRIGNLEKDPTPQNKSDAILWIMRKRSGAKIDPDEFLQYLKGGVDDDTYAQISKDLSPVGISVWLGTLVDNKLSEAQVRKITDKYAAKVKPEFLTRDLGTYVDPGKLGKQAPGEAPVKPKTTDYPETPEGDARFNADMKAYRAKGGK